MLITIYYLPVFYWQLQSLALYLPSIVLAWHYCHPSCYYLPDIYFLRSCAVAYLKFYQCFFLLKQMIGYYFKYVFSFYLFYLAILSLFSNFATFYSLSFSYFFCLIKRLLWLAFFLCYNKIGYSSNLVLISIDLSSKLDVRLHFF